MIIFSLGYLAVFAVFFFLFWHAYRKRKELQLNEFEIFDTRDSLQEMALNCGVAVLSLAVVILGGSKYAGLAGLVYMLIGDGETVCDGGGVEGQNEKHVTFESGQLCWNADTRQNKTV